MSKQIVIIPTYNEIENIKSLIEAVFQLPIVFDVMVVDDNSPDGTASEVNKIQKHNPSRLHLEVRKKKSGLGTAYIHGFKKALELGYDYIIEMDADFSHNPKDLPLLLNACVNEGFDVSIGSRYVKGVNVVNWPMKRILMSWFASKYVKCMTQIPIHDTTAGFVCYKKEVLSTINLDKIQFVGYAFQIEMKMKAYHLNFKIKEIPVIFTDRFKGKSKMNGNIIYEAAFGVIKLKFQQLFNRLN
jgi:dolichol-phosphate mannosyltransferase